MMKFTNMEKMNKLTGRVEKRFSARTLAPAMAVLLLLGASPAQAFVTDGMLCSIDGATRKVYIQLEDPASAVPCEVREDKQINTPDTAVTLWSAGDDKNYCKVKLDGYIEKLRGLGFECW